jgi:hypothetical protein
MGLLSLVLGVVKCLDTLLDILRILSCDVGSFALHGNGKVGVRAPRST